MIDTDVMQGYIREANPVPTLDDLDPDELTAFVTVARTRRAELMQAPTQHPTTPTTPVTPRPPTRRKAWAFAAAFVLLVVAVGIAALARGGSESPVADELTAFVTAARTRRAELMQAPTQHPTTPTTPVAPPPPTRRKAWAFAAAFVLLVVAVGIAALARGGSESPVADEPMAPVTVTTPPSTTAASDPFDVQSLSWSRVPDDRGVLNPTAEVDRMSSVIAGGPGFVALGTRGQDEWVAMRRVIPSDPALEQGAVWFSSDGIDWSLVPNDEPPFGVITTKTMDSVTVGGPGLVAVGGEHEQELFLASEARAWTSEDAATWTEVEVSNQNSRLNDVTAGGPGLVAVGWACNKTQPRGDCLPGIWTSVDGATWTQVPQDPKVFGDPVQVAARAAWSMNAVTVGGPGLVVVGAEVDDQWQSTPAVWTSLDGLTWERVPDGESVFGGGRMLDVVAGGPGLVAVGNGDEGAAVWTSRDGLTWTRVPSDVQALNGEGSSHTVHSLHTVASTGSRLVAIGTYEYWMPGFGLLFDKSLSGEVWTSSDGWTWSRLPMPSDGYIASVAAVDDRLVAVGQDGLSAAVWIASDS